MGERLRQPISGPALAAALVDQRDQGDDQKNRQSVKQGGTHSRNRIAARRDGAERAEPKVRSGSAFAEVAHPDRVEILDGAEQPPMLPLR